MESGIDTEVGEIAVIGMAGRFPESPNLASFWENLRNGRDCLKTFTDADLDELGIPQEIYRRENFVRRGTVLPDWDRFDADFFGYTPKQAEVMDPQARILLETSYEALESAGYNPLDTGHEVGVFAGSNPNDYALLLGVADPTDSLGAFSQLIGADRDFLATRISHNLGLTGPAMTVQTACSTSLVTIHQAVQSLLGYECSMALAGGVSINLRQGVGYFYQPGMILSPDGRCRAFDANAAGTTLGQGCGVVALKRLEDAREDGDTIMAVVRATAVNNDGRNKISYTAPSEDGQAAVIATAHALAGIDSDSIGYVETHGTGTLLGDPIEVAALTRAFRPGTTRTQYCAIGSAKTNFGHTDAAAGVTGFIKAVLSLVHREIPPSLNYESPNPDIDFANSPFFVNAELRSWPEGRTPRRAGVSAFGIGGTNAHVVLEEAPPLSASTGGVEDRRVLLVSARSAETSKKQLALLAEALTDPNPSPSGRPKLEDVDFTLRNGRPLLEHRAAMVFDPLRPPSPSGEGETDWRAIRGVADDPAAAGYWLFTGQGSQYPMMGAGLYKREPVFAAALDRVAGHCEAGLGFDLRDLLFDQAAEGQNRDHLDQTAITQPALFAIEHALACLLRSWNVRPDGVIGHSIGEYAAAVEAGILTWQDAADLVGERARLMQSMPPGRMASVALSSSDLMLRLPPGVELAADNAPQLSVASGSEDQIETLVTELSADGVSAQVLHTSHAFHSASMESAAEKFVDIVANVRLNRPEIPMFSNVTGRRITDKEATDPAFWAGQIRHPVRFRQCIQASLRQGPAVFLEIGPGRALTALATQQTDPDRPVIAVPSMRHPKQDRDDSTVLLEALAKMWTVGVAIDWDKVNGGSDGRRVPLPTYPFSRTRAWLPSHRHVLALPQFGPPTDQGSVKRNPLDQWLYAPSWRREPARDAAPPSEGYTVVLAPDDPAGQLFIEELGRDRNLVVVRSGEAFRRAGLDFHVNPETDDGLSEVFAILADEGIEVTNVVHAWTASPSTEISDLTSLGNSLGLGVHSALGCARNLSSLSRRAPIDLCIVTAGACSVMGGETVRPDAAALLGPTRVIPLEYSRLSTRLVDIPSGLASPDERSAVLGELSSVRKKTANDEVVALRNGGRWVPTVSVRETDAGTGASPFRAGGRYLIVGGLGGVGLSIARFLANNFGASLLLTSRRGRPEANADSDEEELQRLELLREIEGQAGRLEVVKVDAADAVGMADAIEAFEGEAGPLNGVIVAAGVADQAGAIHRRSREEMDASISSKIHGLISLEPALHARDLDFAFFSSSIASVLYHNRFAQVGYVTGNAFAEAFALRCRQRGVNACTVAWDDWLQIGMSVRSARSFSKDFDTDVNLVDHLHSFTPEEGVTLFERSLRSSEPVLLVSTTDLQRRIIDDVDVTSPFLEQATTDDAQTDDALAEATIPELVSSIWKSLLGFEDIQPDDDFFELGGDSLQAARMADRLSRALDCPVPIDTVFESPRLNELAEALEAVAGSGNRSHDPARSAEPSVLSPGQLRFLGRETENPHHFNTSVLLKPRTPVSVDHLRAATMSLVERHDALRLQLLDMSADSDQRQMSMPHDTNADVLTIIDLSASDQQEVMTILADQATSLQLSLDLENGPTFRAVLFQLPDDQQRLLLINHHLMCDRISLLLMIDNLNADLESLAGGKPLPTHSAPSVLDWVDALTEAGRDAAGSEIGDHWHSRPWGLVQPVPVDRAAEAKENRNSTADSVIVSIDGDVAQNGSANTGSLDELILLALGEALAAWGRTEVALIDVLGHGRRLPLGIDVSRAVGMFISYGPVLYESGRNRQEQLSDLRKDLQHGWAVDVLRHHSPDGGINLGAGDRRGWAELPTPEVLFNYVGRTIAVDSQALLSPTDEPRGAEVDPEGRRDHKLAVRAEQTDSGQLELTFVYSTSLHDRSTIEELAAAVRDCLLSPATNSKDDGNDDGQAGGPR